ncbi:MAG: TetR/AcrR family transcriptional regulator [Clostridia bacterium]|nr:TetR/AcrR family transcriptional regulator [Clostridia bacterium]
MFQKSDKRSQIFQAAFKLFAQKGFFHTTVEEVAQEAGIGKGTVYGYFASKQELLRQMLIFATDYYFDTFFRVVEGNGGLKEKLVAIAKEHFRFFNEHREIAKVVLYEHRYITDDLGDWLIEKEQGRIQYLVELLRSAAANGEIRVVDFKMAARMITGALWNLGMEAVISSFSGTEEELAEGIIDILWLGLSRQ